MSLSSSTLTAIQHAGAAVYAAHAALAAEAQSHGQSLGNSMAADPFALETDDLFERWRTLSRLSQELQTMDQQLRAVYASATSLALDHLGRAAPRALAAPERMPAPQGRRPLAIDHAVEDVPVVKPKVPLTTAAVTSELRGTSARVFEHLSTFLSKNEFIHVHQSQAAQAAGIPNGSMNYALKRLVEKGLIAEGDKGTFKLV